jgi:hypothetical protein
MLLPKMYVIKFKSLLPARFAPVGVVPFQGECVSFKS